jgi:hypothetical protein
MRRRIADLFGTTLDTYPTSAPATTPAPKVDVPEPTPAPPATPPRPLRTRVVIARTSSTPQLDALHRAQPDLVDRIFDYLLGEFPQLAGKKFEGVKKDLREEFAGQDVYIPHHPPTERQERVRKVSGAVQRPQRGGGGQAPEHQSRAGLPGPEAGWPKQSVSGFREMRQQAR